MRTFATLGIDNTFRNPNGGTIVGRLVANTSFMEALFAHGEFDRFLFLIGDQRERRQLEQSFVDSGLLEAERFDTLEFRGLPRALAAGEIDVIHHGEPAGRGLDLAWLRDRYASNPLPITGQIHSLSYPRSQADYLRMQALPLSARDAVFCSSTAGREVFHASLDQISESLVQAGAPPLRRDFRTPLLPLGIDAESLGTGRGSALRERLSLSPDAEVVLCLARFTEYDKMDLVPLLRAFTRVRARREAVGREAVLLLAGSTQGTGTVGSLEAWNRLLGLEGAVIFHTDFPEGEKADLLAAADIFVSPVDNPQETFGLSVVEALAAGLPVVCSDFDGYKDTVTDEVGIRVPTSWHGDLSSFTDLGPLLHEAPLHLMLGQSVQIDPEGLEEALHRLLDDCGLRLRMSSAARLRALEHYDWRTLIPLYDATWKELAGATLEANAPATSDGHPLALPFAKAFRSYPTRFGAGDDEVKTAQLGRDLLAAGVSLPIHPGLSTCFSPNLAAQALNLAWNGCSVDSLCQALRENEHARPDDDPHLLIAWLLKHAALRRVTVEAEAPTGGVDALATSANPA